MPLTDPEPIGSSPTPTPWRLGQLSSFDAYTGKPFRNIWAGGAEDGICVARCIDNGNCDADAALIVAAVNAHAPAFAVMVRFEGFHDRYLNEGADPDQPLDGRECRSTLPPKEFASLGEAGAVAVRFNAANSESRRSYVVAERIYLPAWKAVTAEFQ